MGTALTTSLKNLSLMELSVLNVGSGFLYCKNDYASLESIHRLVIKSNYFFIFLDCPRSAGWREHPDQRRRFPFDAREDERGYRRPRSGSGSLEDERDSLPEWCLEDAEEEAGTFDSSGAFHSHKVSGDLAVVFFCCCCCYSKSNVLLLLLESKLQNYVYLFLAF